LPVRVQKDGKEGHRLSPILALLQGLIGLSPRATWRVSLRRKRGLAVASNPVRCITSCPWCTNRAAGIRGTWAPQGTGLHPPRRACSPVPEPGSLSSSRSSWLYLQFKG
jgi:hypothetical protein